MKKTVAYLLFIITLTLFLQIQVCADVNITSQTGILMEADTGQILYSKDMHKTLYPASITKIMTVLLACENANKDEVVTVTAEATRLIYNASHIALAPDEELTLEQLCYAAMMPSANDAANAIAIHISGSMEEFATLMNKKAKELGTLNTNFTNPSGLPDDNHVTTAYDMSLILREALKNEDFVKYYSQVSYEIPATNKNVERTIASLNQMQKNTEFQYEGIIGGKTGWTDEAENTFAVAAERNGRKLICVVMKSPYSRNKYDDAKALFNYGFYDFVLKTVTPQDVQTPRIPYYVNGDHVNDISFSLLEGITCYLHKDLKNTPFSYSYIYPDKINDEIGGVYVDVSVKDDTSKMYDYIGRYEMTADTYYAVNIYQPTEQEIADAFKDKEEIKEVAVFKEEPVESSDVTAPPEKKPSEIDKKGVNWWLIVVIFVVTLIIGYTLYTYILFEYEKKKRRKLRLLKKAELEINNLDRPKQAVSKKTAVNNSKKTIRRHK